MDTVFTTISEASVPTLEAIEAACARRRSALAYNQQPFMTWGNLHPIQLQQPPIPQIQPQPEAEVKKNPWADGVIIKCPVGGCNCEGYRRQIVQECVECGWTSIGEGSRARCPLAPRDERHRVIVVSTDERGIKDVMWNRLYLRGLPVGELINPRRDDGLFGLIKRAVCNARAKMHGEPRVRIYNDPETSYDDMLYSNGTATVQFARHLDAAAGMRVLKELFSDQKDLFINYCQRKELSDEENE